MNTRRTHRPTIERFRNIIQELQRGPKTMKQIALTLEVHEKTIQRDIEFLRDRMGLAIVGVSHVSFEYGGGMRLVCADQLCPLCLGKKEIVPQSSQRTQISKSAS